MKSNLISVISKSLCSFFFICVVSPLFGQDDNDSLDSFIEEVNEIKVSPFLEYFQPLSSSEAQENFNRINTNGAIFNYRLVPNNRPINDSRVSDPHQMLTHAAIDTINQIIKMTESNTGFQMTVVCLNSIGETNPNMFGTELFNDWGVGEKGKDNGFLMLVINDIHRVEFINGYGTETVLSDLQGEDIRQNEMIPHFKNNDYVTGVIRGVQGVSDVFHGVPRDYFTEPSSYSSEPYDYPDSDYSYESTPWYKSYFFTAYIRICIIISIIYIVVLLISFLIKDLHKRYHTLKVFTVLIVPILFPVPFVILLFFNKKLMERWRNTERFSEVNGTYMIKLDEQSDDQHLKKGQIKEETIKSIDYDVWITEDDSDVLILAYKRWFSKYRKCPSCKFKTYFKEYDRVISAATYSSSGTGERKYSCKNCGHSKITTYTIPQKTRSSSSSSGGGYSSGGSSYSSGGGGSSYGGGSSGGGGGGSSW